MKTITKFSFIAMLLCSFSFAKAAVPPTAPPDLTYDAEDVLSFFIEKYGEFTELSTPNWGQKSTWDYTATGDDEGLILISNLEWLPIQNKASAETKKYEYCHIDIFCNEATDFRLGFHSNYPVNSNEVYFPAIKSTSMVAGKWYSIDYPIGDLKYDAKDEETTSWTVSNGFANANLIRFGNAADKYTYSKEIYITNLILFNGEPTCLGGVVRGGSSIGNDVDDLAFNAYVANNELNYSAKETISSIDLYNVSGQKVKSVNVDASTSDISNLASGVYIVAAKFANGEKANLRIVK